MSKVTTRRGRGHLLREAENDFANLKNELINSEVVDCAINIHGLLSIVSSKYTNDAIIDIIPEITLILNKFDASLNVNSDLKESLTDLAKENTLLLNRLENEKNNRQKVFEDSLYCEEKAEEEIKCLNDKIKNLEKSIDNLKNDLRDKIEIINVLSNNTPNDYILPKLTLKPRRELKNLPITTKNRFSIISQDSSPQLVSESIQIQADVHKSSTPTLSRNKKYSNKSLLQDTRRKLIVLTDSQGKDLGPHLKDAEIDFNIFVHSSPGAKLNYVIKNGLSSVTYLTEEDYVIILAGSNDLSKNEPAQYSITKGLKSLFSINKKINVLVNSVPYRHDDPSLNNNIFFINDVIQRQICNYRGPLNLFYGDVNSILKRPHFTRHGLHYNRKGKAVLGSTFTQFIRHQRHLLHLKKSSVLEEETQQTFSDVHISQSVHRNPSNTSAIDIFSETSPHPACPHPKQSAYKPTPPSLITSSPTSYQHVINDSSPIPTSECSKNKPNPCSTNNNSSQPPSPSSPLPPSTPLRKTFYTSCGTPDELQSTHTQSSLDATSASEPWGGARVSDTPETTNNFLDLFSWPNLVR